MALLMVENLDEKMVALLGNWWVGQMAVKMVELLEYC